VKVLETKIKLTHFPNLEATTTLCQPEPPLLPSFSQEKHLN